jgi:hypothetical protein
MQPKLFFLMLLGVLISHLSLAASINAPKDELDDILIADMRVGSPVSAHGTTTYPPLGHGPILTLATTTKHKPHHANPSAAQPHINTTVNEEGANELTKRDTHGAKCEFGSDKAMCYKSGRCQNRIICACCPPDHQDHFGEDCFGRKFLPLSFTHIILSKTDQELTPI